MSALVKHEENNKSELDYARTVGEMIVSSGKWSKEYNKDTVALLVMYAKEIGIHPVKALMCGFDIIQGKITMKPMMMNDMIRKAGHSIQIVHNTDKICELKGTRRDNGDTCTITFTSEDAKKAGLSEKDNYKKWPANMLYARAMGNLARMLFADVVGGVYMEGELDTQIPAKKAEPEEKEQITINVETGEVAPTASPTTYSIANVQDVLGIGTETEIEDLIKMIAIKKGWDEQKVMTSIMEDNNAFNGFKDMLTKRLERAQNVESTQE